jgi:hypothetical protein
MKRTGVVALVGFLAILIRSGIMADPTVHALGSLRYSCSAQAWR